MQTVFLYARIYVRPTVRNLVKAIIFQAHFRFTFMWKRTSKAMKFYYFFKKFYFLQCDCIKLNIEQYLLFLTNIEIY